MKRRGDSIQDTSWAIAFNLFTKKFLRRIKKVKELKNSMEEKTIPQEFLQYQVLFPCLQTVSKVKHKEVKERGFRLTKSSSTSMALLIEEPSFTAFIKLTVLIFFFGTFKDWEGGCLRFP